jgi:hypothetical protein
MKKKSLFFLLKIASIAASAQVTNVEPVGANYANKTVSFRVWWNVGSRDATHLSKVWVWVDYIKVNANNTTSGNTWTRAAVSAASPTASVSYDGSNRQGFWLQGNSGSYSTTVTVQLNVTETKFNWCAYASDFPPNAGITKATTTNGTYTLHGTPPFIIDGTYTTSANSYTGVLITSITDKTNCPGIITVPQYASTYTGCGVWVELVDDATVIKYASVSNTVCTNRYGTGWRVPDATEIVCICNNKLELEDPIKIRFSDDIKQWLYMYWVSNRQRMNLNNGSDCVVKACSTNCGGFIRCVRDMY